MITTHVLDTTRGKPAAGVKVALLRQGVEIGSGSTDADGRLKTLSEGLTLEPGHYQLVFQTGAWFAERDITAFHPEITVTFELAAGEAHIHVPLLLSPFGFTTYRGS
jgi:5-hydroxyisourate hydrolase